MNLTCHDFVLLLQTAAGRLRDQHELLSRLDSATGDGDHGTTMKKVAETIIESVQTVAPSITGLLETVGWNVLSVDGGSTSPLLGSFFMGMAESVGGREEITCSALAELFEAGLAKLRAQTKAAPGDKTMLDAFLPAVSAIRLAAENAKTIRQALTDAADAAAAGAESTKSMQAKFGRARNLGERTIGHVDPGATSISFFFAGLRDGLPGDAS